jgi:hypothetical protein
MASSISAGTTSSTGLVATADTTGALVLQTNNGTTALTLDTSQNATFAGYANLPNTFGFKNRIINGAMVIDQRNAGAATANTISGYAVDRWQVVQSPTTGKVVGQQNAGSVTPPVGFNNYFGITSQSAFSIVAGSIYTFIQAIEGFNFADMAWGTANAQTVTLSFRVYSSLTGTFGGSLGNGSSFNRSYPFTYTISSANTWTTISITIAGDTTGTWAGATNGNAVYVNFGLGVGSTFSGTAGAWAAADYRSATGATSVVGTSGATFYITGVQLEKGSTATSFDYLDYGRTLIQCQRYFTLINKAAGTCNGTTVAAFVTQFPVQMRTAPTLSTPLAAMTIQDFVVGTSTQSSASLSTVSGATINGATFILNNFTGLTASAFTTLTGNSSVPASSEL